MQSYILITFDFKPEDETPGLGYEMSGSRMAIAWRVAEAVTLSLNCTVGHIFQTKTKLLDSVAQNSITYTHA